MTTARREDRIELRATKEEKRLLATAASYERLDVTSFIMRSVLPNARKVVDRAERIVGSELSQGTERRLPHARHPAARVAQQPWLRFPRRRFTEQSDDQVVRIEATPGERRVDAPQPTLVRERAQDAVPRAQPEREQPRPWDELVAFREQLAHEGDDVGHLQAIVLDRRGDAGRLLGRRRTETRIRQPVAVRTRLVTVRFGHQLPTTNASALLTTRPAGFAPGSYT